MATGANEATVGTGEVVLKRMGGGGCSLERTALRAEFPLTGKNTGIFREFVLKLTRRSGSIPVNAGYLSLTSLKQWLHKTGN
jgi:hypothetical protein